MVEADAEEQALQPQDPVHLAQLHLRNCRASLTSRESNIELTIDNAYPKKETIKQRINKKCSTAILVITSACTGITSKDPLHPLARLVAGTLRITPNSTGIPWADQLSQDVAGPLSRLWPPPVLPRPCSPGSPVNLAATEAGQLWTADL